MFSELCIVLIPVLVADLALSKVVATPLRNCVLVYALENSIILFHFSDPYVRITFNNARSLHTVTQRKTSVLKKVSCSDLYGDLSSSDFGFLVFHCVLGHVKSIIQNINVSAFPALTPAVKLF